MKVTAYGFKDDRFVEMPGGIDAIGTAVWVDVLDPDDETMMQLATTLSTRVIDYLKKSNRRHAPRFDKHGDEFTFAPSMLGPGDKLPFDIYPVICSVTEDTTVTIRRHDVYAIDAMRDRIPDVPTAELDKGPEVFFLLMRLLAEDYSQRMEDIGNALDVIAHEVLASDLRGARSSTHKNQINLTSKAEFLNGQMMNSLISLSMLASYFEDLSKPWYPLARARFKASIRSLIASGTFVSDRIDFVLNAVMGMISLEQNRLVNVFSIFTVVFVPPTLLGAIWGMNFKYMPELSWPWGYAFALGLMVLSGLIPYLAIRRAGWI